MTSFKCKIVIRFHSLNSDCMIDSWLKIPILHDPHKMI
jgi:hypothetical protein